MTIDPLRTLDPSLGLVSASTVLVPNEVGLWRTVGLLANGQTSNGGFSCAVGAFDVQKRASITLGAGEAVERFALAPAPDDAEYLLADPGSVDQRIDFVTAGLGRASSLVHDFPWYWATDLLTGEEAHVPAPLVDFSPGVADPNPWDAFFDPSPNGAASGSSEGFAQAAGVAEVLERDAFLNAWRLRTALHRFDVEQMPESVRAAPETRSLLVLLGAALKAGVEPILAFIPGDGAPVETAVCIILSETGPLRFGAVGLKAAAHPVAALRGALQEGLQIRELFLARTPSKATPMAVTDDESRADFWTTTEAIAELRKWSDSFRTYRLPTAKRAPGVDGLAKYLAARDIRSLWVSLTHRLPEAIQEMGWVAGKAICPGTIPLTMDETKGLSVVPVPTATAHPLI
ncbi:YcaO-like family protein [Paenarthrobacter sp. NPDC089322]|uniref:YcaO-like family protein n=1 Tax=Paenarthrobacter sp. NPDC089322 TaxID=3155065 RepID=UPI00343A8BCB